MTENIPKPEILSGPQRRRRWGAAEKVAMVAETQEPGMTVSLVARRHGIAPNQLVHWRRLVGQGALTAAGHEEEAGFGVPRLAPPGSRVAAAARQENLGGRDSEGS